MEKALEILKKRKLTLRLIKASSTLTKKDSIAMDEDIKEIDEAIAELEEAIKPKTCEWQYINYNDSWIGECGAECNFFNNETPAQNEVNFCHKCGGKLIQIEPKDNQ